MALAFGHGLLDLLAAIVFLTTLALLLAFGFQAYDEFAEWAGPPDRWEGEIWAGAYDLTDMLNDAVASPFGDGFWLTAMLLSTLVPTFLHLVVVLASPLAVWRAPTPDRLALADDLERWDSLHDDERNSVEYRAGEFAGKREHLVFAMAAGLAVVLVDGVGYGLSAILDGFGHPDGLAGLVRWFADQGFLFAQWLGD